MEKKDYYKNMGLARDATPDDVKRAYRKLARKYHPDVSKDKDAEVRFKEISEANQVLSDPEKRAAYDQLGANWQAGQHFRPPPGWSTRRTFTDMDFGENASFEHSDFFESNFTGMQGGASRCAGRC